MISECWLKIGVTKSGYGFKPTLPKTTQGKPTCGKNEVAVKLTVEIPDSYFELPELKARISLPEIRAEAPEAKAEMEQRIAKQLKESLGVNVTFETAETE